MNKSFPFRVVLAPLPYVEQKDLFILLVFDCINFR